MRSVGRSAAGLTLAELMVAIGIVSFSLLTLMGVLTYSLGAVDGDRQLSTASNLAREVMESVRSDGFTSIPAGTLTFDGRVPDPKAGDFPPAPYPLVVNEEGDYEVVVSVAPKGVLKSVTVDVYYQTERKVTLQCYLAP